MRLILQKKYKYKLNESPEEVREEIRSLLSTKWNDSSSNMTGEIRSDDSFFVKPKFSFAIEVFGTFQTFALLEGRLEAEKEFTIIRLTARPPYLVAALFYFLLIYVPVHIIISKRPLSFDSFLIPIAIIFFLLFLCAAISFSIDRLRRRFEKCMRISLG